MKLFRVGAGKKGRHVLLRNMEMFEYCGMMDYEYTVSTGKSSRTFRQTVYFRVSEDLMLPSFRLFPEYWYHRIGKWFGMQDINFIPYPEFSQYYLLQGDQPEFIEKFFRYQPLIDHFNHYRGWSVEAVGRYFVMYFPRKLIAVEDLQGFAHIGDALYEILSHRNHALEAELTKGTDPED